MKAREKEKREFVDATEGRQREMQGTRTGGGGSHLCLDSDDHFEQTCELLI